MSQKRILLVGAGHTHLHLVREWRNRKPADAEVTVVSAYPVATYSGMLPGTLAGLYHPDQMQIRVAELCSACGMNAVIDPAVTLNADLRSVTLASGKSLEADLISIGTGSESLVPPVEGSSLAIVPVKPMPTFLSRLEQWKAWHFRRSQLQRGVARPRIAVLGAGAAGLEVGFCINEMFWKQSLPAEVSIFDRNNGILPNRREQTSELIKAELQRRGIQLCLGREVEQITAYEQMTQSDPALLHFTDAEPEGFDLILICIGAVPNEFVRSAPVAKDKRGFLAIQKTLQLTEQDHLFSVGDSATLLADPHPKAGVYAVRQGPVLEKNIRHALSGKPLMEYVPQRSYLSLIASGDENAFLDYWIFSKYGRLNWWLKDRIDRTFMRKYQSLYEH